LPDRWLRPASRILRGRRGVTLYLRSVAKSTSGDLQVRRSASVERVDHPAADPAAPIWMTPALVDAIARRVLELASPGTETVSDESALLTVSEVAARLNVSQAWVYAHKRDLGALRLGTGPKARLRFDAAAVFAELNRRAEAEHSAPSGPAEPAKRARRRLVSRPLPRASRAA